MHSPGRAFEACLTRILRWARSRSLRHLRRRFLSGVVIVLEILSFSSSKVFPVSNPYEESLRLRLALAAQVNRVFSDGERLVFSLYRNQWLLSVGLKEGSDLMMQLRMLFHAAPLVSCYLQRGIGALVVDVEPGSSLKCWHESPERHRDSWPAASVLPSA